MKKISAVPVKAIKDSMEKCINLLSAIKTFTGKKFLPEMNPNTKTYHSNGLKQREQKGKPRVKKQQEKDPT